MLSEFLHAFTIAALTATLFLGGWQGPWANEFPIVGIAYFFLKTFAVYFVVVWSRSTFPRIRIDHLLELNWKFLTPLALAALIVTSLVSMTFNEYWRDANIAVRSAALLVANLLVLGGTFELIRRSARAAREKIEDRAESGEPVEGAPEAEHAPAH